MTVAIVSNLSQTNLKQRFLLTDDFSSVVWPQPLQKFSHCSMSALPQFILLLSLFSKTQMSLPNQRHPQNTFLLGITFVYWNVFFTCGYRNLISCKKNCITFFAFFIFIVIFNMFLCYVICTSGFTIRFPDFCQMLRIEILFPLICLSDIQMLFCSIKCACITWNPAIFYIYVVQWHAKIGRQTFVQALVCFIRNICLDGTVKTCFSHTNIVLFLQQPLNVSYLLSFSCSGPFQNWHATHTPWWPYHCTTPWAQSPLVTSSTEVCKTKLQHQMCHPEGR